MIARRDFLLGTIASSVLPARTRADFAPEDELRTILQDRIDRARQGVGIVASSFDSGRRQKIATYGRSGAPNDRPLDGDTVFELGSITKVFTALLLTEMVTRGKFMKATCMADAGAPLRPAIDLLMQTRRPTNNSNSNVGLGWFVRSGNDDEIVWKDCMTGGYASFAGFSTRLRSGAVVLSNTANSINDIGFSLANPANKIAQYPPEITVDPTVLATYEGIYQMTPRFALAIRAESGRLFVRATGQPEFDLFAQGENRFMRIVDAQGTFLCNKDGIVDRLLWHQGGKYQYCPRVP